MKTKLPTGIELIAAERRRQVREEKWDAGHDDEHDEGQLARAAACYAMSEFQRGWMLKGGISIQAQVWPWDAEWWKPSPQDRLRELVKAGALIAAEIDRLQRIKP